MRKLAIFSFIFASGLLPGCITLDSSDEKSALEIQAIQARVFEADRPLAFRSILSVLQDLGYVIQSASLESGVITAQSPIKAETWSSIGLGVSVAGLRNEVRTYVTATTEEFHSKQTRVRLTFVERRVSSSIQGQQSTDESVVLDVRTYEQVFSKIGDAIFMRAVQR
jgi:environmental stress-induced protein Ves